MADAPRLRQLGPTLFAVTISYHSGDAWSERRRRRAQRPLHWQNTPAQGSTPSGAFTVAAAPQFAAGASPDGSYGVAGLSVSPVATAVPGLSLGLSVDGGPPGVTAVTVGGTSADGSHPGTAVALVTRSGRAERLAFLFCVANRGEFFAALDKHDATLWNRVHEQTIPVTQDELRDLIEMEMANFVEFMPRLPFTKEELAAFEARVERTSDLITKRAYAAAKAAVDTKRRGNSHPGL